MQPESFRVGRGHVSVWQVVLAGLVVIGSAFGPPCGYQAFAQSLLDGLSAANCPPEAFVPPRNCDDVRRIAYAVAIRKKGYANANGNQAPDVMERPYVVNFNDCSTGNAHVACMFNDGCTAAHGKLWGLRSNSARHATTLFEGTSGTKFECDFTPQSSGIYIANNSDTRIGPAFPDPGESMDPAYDCIMNGANTRPLNGFGGSGGPGGLNNMLMALMMQMLRQQQEQTPTPIAVVVPNGDSDSQTKDPAARSDDQPTRSSLDVMKLQKDEVVAEVAGADGVGGILDSGNDGIPDNQDLGTQSLQGGEISNDRKESNFQF